MFESANQINSDIQISVLDKSAVDVATTIPRDIFNSVGPIFADSGPANKHVRISTLNEFYSIFGDNVGDLAKFGQQGMNVLQTLRAGGVVHVCRLLPETAKKSTSILEVHLRYKSDIPVYKRISENGPFIEVDGVREPSMVQHPTQEDESGNPVMVQETIAGFEVKLVDVEYVGPQSLITYEKNDVDDSGSSSAWKVFPLIYFKSEIDGKSGNKFGYNIINDSISRDNTVSDGRRYKLQLYSTNSYGDISTYGNTYYFAFEREAVISPDSTIPEVLHYVYDNLDSTNFYDVKNVVLDYLNDNYEAMTEYMSTIIKDGIETIDIIGLTNMKGNPHDALIRHDDSIDFKTSYIFLKGGHDGTLDKNYPDAVVTDESIETTKQGLLEDYFQYNIDSTALKRCKLVPGGVIFDANYNSKIKRLIVGGFVTTRDDMYAMIDCGLNDTGASAITKAKEIKSYLDSSEASHSIFPHSGVTLNTGSIRYNVTQTYDVAYGLPNLYATRHEFAMYAGVLNNVGLVRTMKMTWLAEDNILDELDANQLNYCMLTSEKRSEYSRLTNGVAPVHVLKEYTQFYAAKGNSVKLSMRNALIVKSAIRDLRTILFEYNNIGEGAAYAMANAEKAFNNVIKKYPSNVKFYITFMQSERDVIMDTCSVKLQIVFPKVIRGWEVTIELYKDGQI